MVPNRNFAEKSKSCNQAASIRVPFIGGVQNARDLSFVFVFRSLFDLIHDERYSSFHGNVYKEIERHHVTGYSLLTGDILMVP